MPIFKRLTSDWGKNKKCYDCGDAIAIGDVFYWNVNKRARIKSICEPCGVKREDKVKDYMDAMNAEPVDNE